jgi:hypothetical protein
MPFTRCPVRQLYILPCLGLLLLATIAHRLPLRRNTPAGLLESIQICIQLTPFPISIIGLPNPGLGQLDPKFHYIYYNIYPI